jgi:hypothetical protein
MKLHLVSLVLASALACACKATSAAVLPPVSSTDAAADAIDHKALARSASSFGYHVEFENSTRRYCRSLTTVNTRIPQKECISESEMIDQLADIAYQNNRLVTTPHSACVAKSC